MVSPDELSIRMATKKDVPQLIELLIRQHGMVNPKQSYYDLAYMEMAVESRLIIFNVLVHTSGKLYGMLGMDSDCMFKGACLGCLLTILPEARGNGFAPKMLDHMEKYGQLDSFASVYGHALTLDTASQKMLLRLGWLPTGIIFDRYYFDKSAQNLQGLDLPAKRTHLVMVQPRAKKSAGIIYPPACLAEETAGIYRESNFPCRIEQDPGPATLKTVMTLYHNDYHDLTEILVNTVGSDFEQVLTPLIQAHTAPADVINVFLNMNLPGCSQACEFLQNSHFFFTGIQPLMKNAEYLIFHRSQKPIDFSHLATIPFFKDVLAYIRGEEYVQEQ